VTGFVWAALGVLGTLATTALGDMVSEEVRDRLDHLPHAILRLAALRLDADLRATVYEDEWMPELTYILKGDHARPITRLYHGTRFALGILVSAQRIAAHLDRPASAEESARRGSDHHFIPGWMIFEGPEGENRNLNRALDPGAKRQLLTTVDLSILEGRRQLKVLSAAIDREGIPRKQRWRLRKQRDSLAGLIQDFCGAREDIEANFEVRFGKPDQD
jgi:hypothetical protein